MSFGNADDPNPYQSPLTTSGPVQPTGPGPALATRSNRLAGAIIDGLIGVALTLPIMFATGYFGRAVEDEVTVTETALMTIFGCVMFFVVHGYLLTTRGQTVGKLLAKTRIVDYHSNQILPFGKLIGLRYVPLWIISMIPLVSLLGLVNLLFIFGPERRCVHDYIAGTKVIDVSTES